MAVYYFDLREGGAFVVDEEGTELRDAWYEMRSAGALAEDL